MIALEPKALVEELGKERTAVMPKVLYISPHKDFSGYASVARDYIMSLDAWGFDVVTRALRYDGGDYTPNDYFAQLDAKDVRGTNIVFQHTTPNEMQRKEGFFNVGAFCWETDRIPDLWVNQLNTMDLVLVPCQDNLETARRCGVIVPVEKVPYACNTDKFRSNPKPFLIPQAEGSFKFLSIFQFSKKKAMELLLKSYLTEFNETDPVLLIIKTYMGPNDGMEQYQRIQQLIQAVKELLRLKSYPRIHLIHGVMEHGDIDRLYATSDCYILPSRGEGWGVPHLDALGFGLPAIATNGTGPTEFITPQCGWLVDSHMSPVIDMPHPHDFLYTGKENWHEPHADSVKAAMREAYSMWSKKERSDAWDKMCMAAKTRTADFSHYNTGKHLSAIVMSYYNMWKANNVS